MTRKTHMETAMKQCFFNTKTNSAFVVPMAEDMNAESKGR